jgi:hypothetical protein
MLVHLGVSSTSPTTVLDPWNGSGTTTAICSEESVPSLGFDINPAMVVVARARSIGRDLYPSLRPLLRHLIAVGKSALGPADRKDPLCAWFDCRTAARVRALTRGINEVLVQDGVLPFSSGVSASPLACLFYVLLFRFVRRSSRAFSVSNPTWVKRSVNSAEKLIFSFQEISSALCADLDALCGNLDASPSSRWATAQIQVADSRVLPVESGSISAILSSPPYCTRIDYAASTRMELALLGFDEAEVLKLREKMLGTTVMSKTHVDGSGFPGSVSMLLDQIASHGSKASSTYYLKTYLDYFSKLGSSISEISRVAAENARVALVVQESAYKDVRVDLPALTVDLMVQAGFRCVARWDYKGRTSMGNIRSNSREPTESVVLFGRS